MKFKAIVFTIALVAWAAALYNAKKYFDSIKSGEESAEFRPGQSLVAPKKEQLIKPLMTEVDFLDADIACQNIDYTTTTDRLIARFSRCGASVSQLTGRKIPGIEEQELTFINASQPEEREHGAFLVALQEKTPLNYELVAEQHTAAADIMVFRARTASCIIEKEFMLHHASYRIDMQLTIEPLSSEGVQARLFVPSPKLSGDRPAENVQGIMFNDSHQLEKKKVEALENRLWVTPTLFGSEDRYFITALIADPQQFVQRAYYKVIGAQRIAAILEGPTIQQKSSWKLSFYCGPKQITEMNAVDRRLQAALDYGWFSPLSKIAMEILNFIYRYVHNYGWAIILLTILIKLLLVPFSMRAEKSAKRAAEMKKKLHYLEQKYKHDPETLTREKAELIKKTGLFDVGCLSIFIQLPVVLALQKTLSASIELYKAPFVGWIHDLSAVDPYYILPALVGVGIFMQSSSTGDARQRMLSFFMALVISGVLMNISAGLVLFICASTWLSIVQAKLQKMYKA